MLIDLVGNFTALMNHHNLSYWVDSGTLLGAVRHQGLIPYDQDSDFGIDEDAYAYIRDNRIDVPAPYVLHVWNSSVNDRGNRDEPLPIRLINSDSGLYSDVFVFKRGVDRFGRPLLGPIPSGCFGSCAKCVIVDGEGHFEVPRDWIYPLATCKFAHFNVTCPRESIKYVEYMFGDDYMTPQ
ncbi:TPA: hypothetical protein N0F65_000381 [Lagenidium giganteum]|uniref:LicD/FKTN/FKRP nucleotidyltransferase domain-containing protein n=1 Tax=Lagenidium giganteum TaxID=4803 RepID=A0AAV2Z2W5_9STRA|nr:TPA: hypothetical protein N0F65_000381 [Lagenidium giganteum]